MTDDASFEVFVEGKAGIILQRTLWHEAGITHIRIIEIIEGGHAETLLDVGSHGEESSLEGVDVDKNCRSQFLE